MKDWEEIVKNVPEFIERQLTIILAKISEPLYHTLETSLWRELNKNLCWEFMWVQISVDDLRKQIAQTFLNKVENVIQSEINNEQRVVLEQALTLDIRKN